MNIGPDSTEEVHKRTIRGRQAVGYPISINLLVVVATIIAAYAMVPRRGKGPVYKGEAVLGSAQTESDVA